MKEIEPNFHQSIPTGTVDFVPGTQADIAISNFLKGLSDSIYSVQVALVPPQACPDKENMKVDATHELIRVENLTKGNHAYYVKAIVKIGQMQHPDTTHKVCGITPENELLFAVGPGVWATPTQMFDFRQQLTDTLSDLLKEKGFGGNIMNFLNDPDGFSKLIGGEGLGGFGFGPPPDEGDSWKPPGWSGPGDPV